MSDAKTVVRWVVWHPDRLVASVEPTRMQAILSAQFIWGNQARWPSMESAGWRCTRIEEPA